MRLDLKKWGNSLGLRIPQHIVEELSMQPNTQVECSVKEGKLVVEVVHQLEYTLDELLCQEIEPEPEIDWGKPQGKEVW